MKQLIDKAPEAIKKNYTTRLFSGSSMAGSWLAAAEYAWKVHFDVERYRPVYGVIAERLKTTGDMYAFRLFCVAHADELRAEQEADRRWLAERATVTSSPSFEEKTARNAAAAAADRLEVEISQRADQLMRERELAARAGAFADARAQLGGKQ
jgi:hypothetical protein